jgi:hypothetical protein
MSASDGASPGASPGPAQSRRTLALTFLARLALNAAVPAVVYIVLRPHLDSDVLALVIAAAIPVSYTAGTFAWRRHMDAVGVIAIACFAIGLLVVVVTGGNEMAFKLREEIWTGPLGLACLVSAAVRRPLFLLVLQALGRTRPDIAERIRRPAARRITTVATVVIGAVLVVHAVVLILLALNTSTETYLAVSKPVSWAIVIAGLAPLVWWIRYRIRP